MCAAPRLSGRAPEIRSHHGFQAHARLRSPIHAPPGVAG